MADDTIIRAPSCAPLPPVEPSERARARREEREREEREQHEIADMVALWSFRFAGALFLAVGLLIVTLLPNERGVETVDLQRLFMGMTFSIIGAIFAAAG